MANVIGSSAALFKKAASFVGARVLGRPSEARAFLNHVTALARQEADPTPLTSPFVSLIVPVFNTRIGYLDTLVASVRGQRPGAWELILTDDASTDAATRLWLDSHAKDADLKIVRCPENGGIAVATRAGLALASAPWVGFLDHDDALAPYALDRIWKALEAAPKCEFLYTDEIVTDSAFRPLDFFLKPAFDPVLLSGVNYVNHLALYRRARLEAIGGVRNGFDGSQDYDCLLRYTRDLKADECFHLPYPAYFWRRDGASYSIRHFEKATSNARRAIADAFESETECPVVGAADHGNLHRVRFDRRNRVWPKVSVIIPNKDSASLIARVLSGLTKDTDYPDFEIIVVDNGTTDPAVLALYDTYRIGPLPFRAIVEPEAFNFSRAVNKGLALARGERVLLLNNDIEIQESHWLTEMVSCFDFPGVGVVGAKLLYANRTIQHAGVIVGFGGLAGHWYLFQDSAFPGPMGRFWVRQSLSAVTGACMMLSRQAIEKAGLFDEEEFAIAYNDIDYCLRVQAAGFRVMWTPFACLVHHESATRGSDETPENIARFRREQDNLRSRHRTDTFDDPAINPWYSKDRSFPVWKHLPRLPRVR